MGSKKEKKKLKKQEKETRKAEKKARKSKAKAEREQIGELLVHAGSPEIDAKLLTIYNRWLGMVRCNIPVMEGDALEMMWQAFRAGSMITYKSCRALCMKHGVYITDDAFFIGDPTSEQALPPPGPVPGGDHGSPKEKPPANEED